MAIVGTGVITFTCTTTAEYNLLLARLRVQEAETEMVRKIVVGNLNATKRTISVTVTLTDPQPT